MGKIYSSEDVLTAARKRIAWTFDTFEKMYVSFSGGKDSTVMLHLVMEEAIKRDRRVGVLIVDLEGQYKHTINNLSDCVKLYESHIDLFWVCLPISLRNAVSVYEPKWLCWEPGKEDIWIRQPPELGITESIFDFFEPGMEFEEFVPLFGEWYAQGQSCACLVGIRADESLHRFRTIASIRKQTKDGKQWTTLVTNNVYNVYPIYDWATKDLWLWHSMNPDLPYNKLYDLMFMAGVPYGNMRICQPYGDDQRKGLWLFHLVEPETWARVVSRVNGANGGSLYMQEWGNVNGYRKITKPPGHTWQSFSELLLASMPPQSQEQYQNKILLFQKWHMERDYPDGIPDEAHYEMEAQRKAPSWRRICKMLLRNDYWGKGLGFTQHKSDAYIKYLDLMKRRKSSWSVGSSQLQFPTHILEAAE
jgi:predicted phosphoadenosine phosphosulfate sulfurtransferase